MALYVSPNTRRPDPQRTRAQLDAAVRRHDSVRLEKWELQMSRRMLLQCLAAFVVPIVWARPDPPVARGPRVDFSQVEIRTTRVSENLFVLEGQGGAISVLTGPDGVLMVDSQFAPLTDKIRAAIRQISDQPIRFLVNTHVHADHIGGNESLAETGTLIFGRDQLRSRLMHPSPGPNGQVPRAAPVEALPVVTYDGPVTLHINGEDVQLIPVRGAHTDGDTMIRFPKGDVLVVGDFYRSVGFPYVDIDNGGTLEGLLAGLDKTIELSGPKTKIVPGHGPIVDRNAVMAQRDLILATRDRMLPLIAKRMTYEQVLAANLTADSQTPVPAGAQTAEQFIWWLYVELTESKPRRPK